MKSIYLRYFLIVVGTTNEENFQASLIFRFFYTYTYIRNKLKKSRNFKSL